MQQFLPCPDGLFVGSNSSVEQPTCLMIVPQYMNPEEQMKVPNG